MPRYPEEDASFFQANDQSHDRRGQPAEEAEKQNQQNDFDSLVVHGKRGQDNAQNDSEDQFTGTHFFTPCSAGASGRCGPASLMPGSAEEPFGLMPHGQAASSLAAALLVLLAGAAGARVDRDNVGCEANVSFPTAVVIAGSFFSASA